MRSLRLLVSFDYELFLGRNHGSDDEVLFGPTRRVLERCARLEAPVTFFADVCSVWAHRDHGLHAYADAFEAQLERAHALGHDVQLHLHPHWLFARHTGEGWQPDPERLYLSECGFGGGPREAPALVARGKQYLEGLLGSGYRCLAFRAPGLVLQPRERDLIAALSAEGLRFDSSVVKGMHVATRTTAFDYRRTPSSANWRIDAASGIEHAAADGLYEVPIATFPLPRRDRLRFLARRLLSVGKLRGTSITREATHSRLGSAAAMVANNLRYLGSSPLFALSCDTKGFDLPMLQRGLVDYVERHDADEQIAVSMLNHPKLMFDAQLDLLDAFIRWSRSHWGANLQVSTFRGLYDEGWPTSPTQRARFQPQ